jgi:hypothetical protein
MGKTGTFASDWARKAGSDWRMVTMRVGGFRWMRTRVFTLARSRAKSRMKTPDDGVEKVSRHVLKRRLDWCFRGCVPYWPFSMRSSISEYAASIRLRNASELAGVAGFSFTWRMNLPVPCSKRAGSGSDAP